MRVRGFTCVFLAAMVVTGACDRDEEPQPPSRRLAIGMTATGTLDPARAGTGVALALIGASCDGLLRAEDGIGRPRPGLISEWESDPSGRRFLFGIAENRTFHDGVVVDARSVAANLDRVAQPGTGSPWASLLGSIEGFRDLRDGDSPRLRGVRVLGEHELEVRLGTADSELPDLLTHPGLTPVSPASLEEDQPPHFPTCSGPFEFEMASSGDGLALVPTEAGATRLEIRTFEGIGEAYDAFRARDVQAAPVPQALAFQLRDRPGYQMRSTPAVTYLRPNTRAPITDDVRVRRAISLGIDRLLIIDAGFGDDRAPARSWTSDDPPADCARYAKRISDVAVARKILAELLSDASQVTLPLRYRADRVPAILVDALVAQVGSSIEVSLRPEPMDGERFESSLNTPGDGLWMMEHEPVVPGSGRTLESLFGASGSSNQFSYRSPEVEQALAESRRQIDREARMRTLASAESQVCLDMPAIPLWHGAAHWVVDTGRVQVSGEILDGRGDPLLRNFRSVG